MTPPRLCNRPADCETKGACVAGRCVADGAVPAIASARRLLYAPVDVAYVGASGRGGASGPSSTAIVCLGRGDGAYALLRFSIDLPREAKILEAYLLLRRATDVPSDPSPVALHVARVVEAWDGRDTTRARAPRIEEVGSAVTLVLPASGPLVRLDLTRIADRWRKRRPDDQGIAIVADGSSVTGIALALDDPRVELYVR